MYVTSSPVATPSPTSAVRPGAPAQRGSIAYRSPASATRSSAASAASASRAVRDLDLEGLGLRRLADLAERIEQPREQRAELELVEQHPDLLAVELPMAQLVDLDTAVDVER